MTPEHPELLALIDVETGGLDERVDELLEISAIVTDNQLNPVDDGISVIIRPDTPGWRDNLHHKVVEMHNASGLFDDIDAGLGISLDAADRKVAEYLDDHRDGVKLIFVGNSITLDRNFLRAKAPTTFARLHYRSLDITSIRNFTMRMLGLPEPETSPAGRHRGIDDLHDAIGLARALQNQLQERMQPAPLPTLMRGLTSGVQDS